SRRSRGPRAASAAWSPVYGGRGTAPRRALGEGWKVRQKRRAASRPPAKTSLRVVLGGRFRPAAAPGNSRTRQRTGAGITEVGLLGAAPRVGVIHAHHRALSFPDLRTAVIAHENRLSSHAVLLVGAAAFRIA